MQDEGQLRYWTSDMCNRYPHLFDFVVTVCITLIAKTTATYLCF